MISHVFSAALRGIDARMVKVEVDVRSQGLPGWSMVGMLETAVKEARDRVTSAIRNSGYSLPETKTIVSLAPADMKKAGAHFDLAIAAGLLSAVGLLAPYGQRRFLIAGELSLAGRVLPIHGSLLMALAAKERGLDGIVLPAANAWEANLAGEIEVIGVETLSEAVSCINGESRPRPHAPPSQPVSGARAPDFSEVRGQPFAKRGLEIAAAGGHNAALVGPPGTGKTMLAERLPSILPPLTDQEALEVLRIRSWHGLLAEHAPPPSARPFRSPHHSASYAGLVGGGMSGSPTLGEISLAHNGVLFMDEMAEFRKDVLEVLRQPLESGRIGIVRAGVSVTYPASFMLIAAFNPCPCGYFGHPTRPCSCGIMQMKRYRAKLSGPLMDRIDIHVVVGPPAHEAILGSAEEEGSEKIFERVTAARRMQHERYGSDRMTNAHLAGRALPQHCRLGREEKAFIKAAASKASLSARSVHRVIKVARTIADLEGSAEIEVRHAAEALQFRAALDEI